MITRSDGRSRGDESSSTRSDFFSAFTRRGGVIQGSDACTRTE
jgi:hypothetical protein